jgi:Fe2+ or Zn2+ uptake regulation protein
MKKLISGANLEATSNRVHVLEVVGENRFPLSASDIYKILKRSSTINQVTVYRILDLLVEKELWIASARAAGHFITAWRPMITTSRILTFIVKIADKWIV